MSKCILISSYMYDRDFATCTYISTHAL